jgi:hypothetical protein
MVGIGRECGIESSSPPCNLRNRNPASTFAAVEKGGVYTSTCSQASGLCFGLTVDSVCQNGHIVKGPPNFAFERSQSTYGVCSARATTKFARASLARCLRGAGQRER